ncbi:MAG: tRNA lysidine(34) synthetase TilS [Balneola sp.]|nr:tRNA lysidine(34) synthetase TilS [Balneola sp.]MBO6712776.1 tRNA lysidine(34) synthetase TilS [Balneola sp.]MBO6801075.1 tRNA lysidine(34) synthetase TilS [Balneola sp.]MBO6871267.1 tRNA lysidine(34) synthetase TilS [Balneola sp.]
MSKSEYLLIEQGISNKLSRYFSGTPKLVIGVSGGADSMALLYAFKRLEISCFVVHINYGLRGVESDKDQELVEQMSFQWGFECCSVRLNTEEMQSGNFQNWARNERYKIFEDLADEVKADAIATAHHQDDQVETIIQKLFRGSSPESWEGMKEWGAPLFRPMLEFSKEEILEYCDEKSIPYRDDESNSDPKYSRNFLRGEFTKKMNNLFPGWQQNVLGLSDFGALNEQMLDELSEVYLEKERIKLAPLKNMNEVLARSLIKRFLEQYIPTASKGIIGEAYALLSSQTGSELKVSDSVVLVKDRDFIVLQKKAEFIEVIIKEEDIENAFSVKGIEFRISEQLESELYLDVAKLSFPLILRRWKAGDKIQPLGMDGTQKVSDHLTNRKVSNVNREKSLVLSDSDGTIYAIIFKGNDPGPGTISELCKATDSTKRYLSITSKKQA